MIPMHVREIALDPMKNPVILLVDEPEARVLPIWIGIAEAQAIALALEGLRPERPLTHDLLLSACNRLGGVVSKVVISDLRDGTFFAELHLTQQGQSTVIDARPSDAIALALRSKAPIYVTPKVAEQAMDINDLIETSAEADSEEPEFSPETGNKRILH